MPGGAAPLAGRLFKHALSCGVLTASQVSCEGPANKELWDAFAKHSPASLVAGAAGAASADPAADVARSALAGAGLTPLDAAQQERRAVIAAVHANEGKLVPLADVSMGGGGVCLTVGQGDDRGWDSAAPVRFRLLREWASEVLPEISTGRTVFLPPGDAAAAVEHLRCMAARLPPSLRRVPRGAAPPSTPEPEDGVAMGSTTRGAAGGVWQSSWILGQHSG